MKPLVMKKIKVAHIAHSVGGVDVYLRINLKALNPERIECMVIHGKDDTENPFLDRNGMNVPEFKASYQRAISPWKDLVALRETIKILKREKPDVIHAHSAKGGIIARAASLWYPVTVLYTPHAFSFLSTPRGLKRAIYLNIERLFKRFHSVVIACSNSERIRAIKEVGYKESRARVFNNCIQPISAEDMETPEMQLPSKFICTIGRPSYQKNIEMLVRVVKVLSEKIPDIHLIVMGVGAYSPNKEVVEGLIQQHNLSNHITLIPWIAREQIFSIINKSMFYVSASRYEGLPYSVIESLALAKASVVTDCDGNRDLIKDGYNGYVVPENSVETMANRIFALLKDETKRKEMEKNALAHYHEHFNIETSIEKLEDIYKEFSK
jgi:glycosyltransferase involved in cell wall biosynthesis